MRGPVFFTLRAAERHSRAHAAANFIGLHRGWQGFMEAAPPGFKLLQNGSRRWPSAHFPSITEISADCRWRLQFVESARCPSALWLLRFPFPSCSPNVTIPPGSYDNTAKLHVHPFVASNLAGSKLLVARTGSGHASRGRRDPHARRTRGIRPMGRRNFRKP